MTKRLFQRLRAALPLAALPLVALTACSSASDAGAGSPGGASIPAAFSKYCTGTLKVDKPLMKGIGTGTWQTDGSKASAGTTFLVSPGFGHWEGFVLFPGSTPAKFDDRGTGLIKDTDFTSDCAKDPASFDGRHTLVLTRATIYPNKDLTGTPCVLEAGTELTNYSIAGAFDGPATISADELKAQCSLTTGYTNDLYDGELLAK